MKGNVIVGQSGGPTAAINASLAGVYRTAKDRGANKVYGMLHGIQGLLKEKYIDLSDHIKTELDAELLKRTPAAFLGSCRYKLPEIHENREVYDKIFEILDKLDIEAFIYIGGNDSMDTIKKLSDYAIVFGHSIRFIGCPKTIDNDLALTDHTPGYGSAAKYIGTSMKEIIRDSFCLEYEKGVVSIVEIMGRNAGWLTAASALARIEGRKVPQLIYLCEKAFDEDQFIKDVNEALKKENNIIIAVSEGVKTADGNYVGEETKSGKEDVFGHKYLSGVGKYLEGLVGEKIGCKVRSVELNILQRCAGYMLSETDIMESRNLGAFAAVSAIRGKSGKMSAVRRISDDPYQVEIVLSDLSKIANYEKKVPMEWINEEGNDIKDELLTYLKPLIQGEVQIPYENGIPKRFIL